ncbi:MAG: 50S ribosomal protein L5 [Bacillota bacterium]|jgi:large subunit ribosomal protein L5|nr:50S ribosomal protein L5 [Bacillota bacterium]NLU54687.1 50S ribosomal protein L5 [Bacillota bacterium]HOA90472.1 50S ribosomal protein L5 [Bacillota bacterium]HOJ46002.1 50S ribosomal protein L5 [Bacillota bacterium]HOL12781.1 50S ribosomal protein L5 [Bacillota bacterium]
MPRLKDFYQTEVSKAMMEKFGYKSTMEVPKLVKVVVNMGVGEAKEDPKALDAALKELGAITGQKPVITRAKKSVAAFKIRQGMAIGCKVTLRGDRMYDFLDRLLSIGLPRIRDFQGISPKGFDGRGNFTLGIKEQIIFPEVSLDEVSSIRGMDISVVTTAQTDEEAFELLKLLGMPFKSA